MGLVSSTTSKSRLKKMVSTMTENLFKR